MNVIFYFLVDTSYIVVVMLLISKLIQNREIFFKEMHKEDFKNFEYYEDEAHCYINKQKKHSVILLLIGIGISGGLDYLLYFAEDFLGDSSFSTIFLITNGIYVGGFILFLPLTPFFKQKAYKSGSDGSFIFILYSKVPTLILEFDYVQLLKRMKIKRCLDYAHAISFRYIKKDEFLKDYEYHKYTYEHQLVLNQTENALNTLYHLMFLAAVNEKHEEFLKTKIKGRKLAIEMNEEVLSEFFKKIQFDNAKIRFFRELEMIRLEENLNKTQELISKMIEF